LANPCGADSSHQPSRITSQTAIGNSRNSSPKNVKIPATEFQVDSGGARALPIAFSANLFPRLENDEFPLSAVHIGATMQPQFPLPPTAI